jgi:hypothetical protein
MFYLTGSHMSGIFLFRTGDCPINALDNLIFHSIDRSSGAG